MSNLQSVIQLLGSKLLPRAVVAVVSSCSVVSAVAASDQDPPVNPSDSGPVLLIDLLPDASNRAAVVTDLTSQLARPVSLVPPDPVLLELLRWTSPDTTRDGCTGRIEQLIAAGTVTGPGAGGSAGRPPFDQLLQVAESQLSDLQLDEALRSLEQAEAILPCSDTIINRDTVRTLFLLEAVAHIYRKDGAHRASVIDTLGVDSSLYLGQKYPPKVQNVFLETAQGLMERQPLRVAADGGSAEDLQTLGAGQGAGAVTLLYVDGQPAVTFQVIRPGRHVLQAQGPMGQIRTSLVSLSEETSGPVHLGSLTTFGLATRGEARSALSQSLLATRLDTAQVEALKQYVSRRSQHDAVFVLADRGAVTPELRRFDADTGQTSEIDGKSWPRAVPSDAPSGPRRSERIAFQLRAGGGKGFVTPDAPGSTGAVLEVGASYGLTSGLSVAAFGKLRREGSQDSGSYSSWTAGLLASWRLPLGQNLAFVPGVGYAFGVGPAAALSCHLEPVDTHEEYFCGDDGEALVWTRIQAHGPVVRLDLSWRPGAAPGAWSFHIGVDGHAGLVSRVEDGTAQISGGGEQVLPFHVGSSEVFSARVELLAGISRYF